MMQMYVFKMNKASLATSTEFTNLNDGNAIHRLLTKAVHSDRKNANLLYRLMVKTNVVFLYVMTDLSCDISLIEQNGLRFLYTVDISELMSPKNTGDEIRFAIKLLPYRRHSNQFSYLNDISERIQWMVNKLSSAGLLVTRVRETAIEPVLFQRGRRYINMNSSVFEGIATITNKDALLQAIQSGIGREKCFGAGLLMILP